MAIISPVRSPIRYPASRLRGLLDIGVVPSPALRYDFANAEVPRGLTVARAGTVATYVGADGTILTAAANAPRIDHDPVTGQRALLREPQRINIAPSSRDLTTGHYYKGDVTIVGLTGVRITATNTGHQLLNSLTLAGATQYAASQILRTGNRTWVQVLVDPGDATNYHWANINLLTGTIGSTSAGANVIVRNMGALGWLCCLVFTTPAVPTGAYFGIYAIEAGDASLAPTFLGDGEIGYYADEWQCEAGHCPTSRIRTTDSSVTRPADVLTIVGTAFAEWWNAAQGSALVEAVCPYAPPAGSAPVMLTFRDASSADRISFHVDQATAAQRLIVTDDSATEANVGIAASFTPGAAMRIAAAWAPNRVRAAVGGVLTDVDETADMPTVIAAQLGSRTNLDGQSANVPWLLRSITYWPQQLPDAALATLTEAAL